VLCGAFFWEKFMTPRFRIVVDGTDITALLNDRLIQLSVTDKTGMESDEFELRIDDRDGLVTLPRRGVGDPDLSGLP
jgi:phage protein D